MHPCWPLETMALAKLFRNAIVPTGGAFHPKTTDLSQYEWKSLLERNQRVSVVTATEH